MTPISISQQTARRFVLGKQGLWPGRRWKGQKGTAQAIRECEAVQLDPLNIFARSQDIVLHSRVLDYKPDYLYQVAYQERECGRKDTSLALFDMWLCGELMIHHREGFARIYDFRENIAPKEYDYVADEKEAEDFFFRQNISFQGLFRASVLKPALQYDLQHNYSRADVGQLIATWLESGKAEQVKIENGRDTYLVLAEDVPALESLEKGKVPKEWKPKEATTLDEVTFVSPLDIVSARGRAKKLFDFDYVWEVYVPAHKRRWGYYVLPILYGDDLVARLDPKLDRTTMTLEIKGFWQEEDAPVKDADFAHAFAKGLLRFAKFVNAKKVDVSTIQPAKLRKQIETTLKAEL